MNELSLKKSHGYLRQAFNQKLQESLGDMVKNGSLSPFLAIDTKQPELEDLNLVEASSLVASGLTRTLNKAQKENERGQDASVLSAVLTNQPQIFRIHRDMLYTSMSRKQRILSGVTELLRKGYCNNKKRGVYL